MANIQSFRDLDVWRLGMDLVDAVLSTTRRLPRVEFDLRRQINRAVISIPSNIAEGWKRKRRRGAYQNHVSIAMGSHAELETQLEVCFRNGYLDREKCHDAWTLLVRVGPLLERLHDALDELPTCPASSAAPARSAVPGMECRPQQGVPPRVGRHFAS